MSEKELDSIIDKASFIVDGYAFSRDEDTVRVLALQAPGHALVLSYDDEVLETNMDDIELAIVLDQWKKNKKYL